VHENKPEGMIVGKEGVTNIEGQTKCYTSL
jgi:hypothetical protein